MKNWDLVRIIKLIAGIGLGAFAIASKEYMFLIFAFIFIMQSLLNISCCGAGGCGTDNNKDNKQVYKGQIEDYKG